MAGGQHNRSTRIKIRRVKNLDTTLSNSLTKKNQKNIIIPCPNCSAFVQGEIGLKIHEARKHKSNKSLPIISSTFFSSSSITSKGQSSSEEVEEIEEEEEDDKNSWYISKPKAIFTVSAVTDKMSSTNGLSSSPYKKILSSTPSSSSKMFQKRHRDEDFHNLSNISSSTNSSLRELKQDPIISCKYCFDQFYEDKYFKLHMEHWHSKEELQSGPSEKSIQKSNGNSCTTANNNTKLNEQSNNNTRVNRMVISITADGKPLVSSSSSSTVAKEKAQNVKCQSKTDARESSSTNQNPISFKCTHCNYSTKSRPELMTHLTSKHKVRSSFPCPKCDFVGFNLLELIKHACPCK